MVRTSMLHKLITTKYDKLVVTFGNDVLYSKYTPDSHDEMTETFLYMSLNDKIRFEDRRFSKYYLDSFEKLFIYIKDTHAPDVHQLVFDRFQRLSIEEQLNYMTTIELATNSTFFGAAFGIISIVYFKMCLYASTFTPLKF